MFVLKLEQNLFAELAPDKINSVEEKKEGDSLFRTLAVNFWDGAKKITVEKRKYPYFYKYYLYLDEGTEPVDLKSEQGIRLLLAFYQTYCPEYVKDSVYDETGEKGLEDYFDREKIPGESMQHYVPGQGAVEEEENQPEEDQPAVSTLEGYHAFTEEEKGDIGGQLNALKDQFADQLKELEALMKKVES